MDSQSITGNTPLHVACLNGQDIVISDLIKYGASVNAANQKGLVRLQFCAFLSFPFLPFPFLSFPFLSFPSLSFPSLPCLVLSFPFPGSFPFLFFSFHCRREGGKEGGREGEGERSLTSFLSFSDTSALCRSIRPGRCMSRTVTQRWGQSKLTGWLSN